MLAKISQGVAKLIFLSFGFARGCEKFARGCEKFARGCEIHFPQFRKACKISQGCKIHSSQHCSLSCSLYSSWAFCKGAKISHSHVKLLDVRFLLWFSSLHTWLIWKRLRSSPKLGFFMCLSFNLLCHGLHKVLPHSWLVLIIKKLPKTPKLAKN